MTDNGAPKREDNQLIAAEYVLGVLGVSEWREVEQRIAGDQIFAREVAFWEERLGGLAEGTPAVAPPASAWARNRGSSRQGRAAGGNACRYMAKPRLLARPCFEHERTCSGVSCRTDLCRRRDTATYTARRATPRRRRKDRVSRCGKLGRRHARHRSSRIAQRRGAKGDGALAHSARR